MVDEYEIDIPTNMVEVMIWLKQWLDLCDDAIALLGAFSGIEPPEDIFGKSVQGDLLMWAEWFRQHPDIDAQMLAMSSLAHTQESGD